MADITKKEGGVSRGNIYTILAEAYQISRYPALSVENPVSSGIEISVTNYQPYYNGATSSTMIIESTLPNPTTGSQIDISNFITPNNSSQPPPTAKIYRTLAGNAYTYSNLIRPSVYFPQVIGETIILNSGEILTCASSFASARILLLCSWEE